MNRILAMSMIALFPALLLAETTAAAAPAELQPRAFDPLPLGAVKPAGWLEKQLRIQCDGLSGNLDLFWPDVKDSGWIGGKAEGWERMPYWLDGALPLAYLLDDAALKGRIEGYMNYILEHQQDDGWLGPQQSQGYKERDPWPVFVMLKVLTQYQEVTQDARVIPAMVKFLHCLDAQLDRKPLFDWNKSRWQDAALVIEWLYERAPEPWLLALAEKLQNQGYDWVKHFSDLPYKERVKKWEFESHVVNNAMAVKAPSVQWRLTNRVRDFKMTDKALEELDKYHGQFTGIFTGDECFAGKNPSQGSELCSVVEYLFSLETAGAILGEVPLFERLERIAFNALPATFTENMWAHQYDQQANQVTCALSKERVYTTNGEDANLFGLEPNYGCCTANLHQGWPKFTSSLWMRPKDGGLAAVAYAPSTVTTKIGETDVTVSLATDYPFGDTLTFTVRAAAPVTFPLVLRVPVWAVSPAVSIDRGPEEAVQPGAFHAIAREWGSETMVTLRLPMQVRAERRYNNAIALEYGPIVLSLQLGTYWKKLRGDEPHADYEVFPTTPWNYALRVDDANPAASVAVTRQGVSDSPFSPEKPPITATVTGRLLPDWLLERHAAAPPPQSPVVSTQPDTTLTLIPYGCAKLRVTEFPVLE